MSDGLTILILVISVLGAAALPFVILACAWPVLRKTRVASKVAGSKKRPSRWRTRKMLLIVGRACLSPFIMCFKGLKRLGGLLNLLTKQKPEDLAPVLVWIIVTALLFMPLFGNPFSQAGWSNAFSEPAGFIVFITIALVTLLLVVSANRSGMLDLSEEWKRVALRSTIALLVLGSIGYFLFFALQAQNAKEGSKNVSATHETSEATTSTTPSTLKMEVPPPTTSSSQNLVMAPTTPIKITATLTGTEEFGVKLFDLKPGQSARVAYEGGQICEKFHGTKECLNLWGFESPNSANYSKDRWRTPQYRYSSIPGVNAGEMLVILGEIGTESEVLQFLEGETSVEVINPQENEMLPLTLFLHVNEGSWVDSSNYAFPTRQSAISYGHPNVRLEKGFQQKRYEGLISFRAEILD